MGRMTGYIMGFVAMGALAYWLYSRRRGSISAEIELEQESQEA